MAETTSINSNVINNTSNPLNYIDNIISLKIIKTIDTLTRKFTRKNIILLVLLFGADGIKKYFSEFLSNILKKQLDFNYKKYLCKLLFFKTKKITNTLPLKNTLDMEFETHDSFWVNLYDNYKKEFDKFIINSKIIQKKNNYIIEKTFNSITVLYKDISITFLGNNMLSFDKNKELLSTRTSITCDSIITKDFEEYFPFQDFLHDYYTDNSVYEDGNMQGLKEITLAVQTKFTTNQPCENLISCILQAGRKIDDTKFTRIPITDKFTLFGIEFYKGIRSGAKYPNHLIMKKYPTKLKQEDQVREWVDSMSSFKKNIVKLSSDNTKVNLLETFTEFINHISKEEDCEIITNNIKIHDINVNRIIKVTQALQQEKITEVKDYKGNVTKTVIPMVPEKTEIEAKINVVLSNEMYKDFSTLYLKEKDKFKLTSILKNFKTRKNIYNTLGIPYKFGALLYGVPGCGKSSAITAIASYLSRDIYYLDLNNIKTNEELKMVFNHVNKELNKNAIIVMEDIDAMTDIVHIRTESTKNSELTLECFLNLLQGTLTSSGSIFLATTNHLEKLDPAFYRDGRFDIKIKLEECDHYQFNLIYNKFFNRNIPQDLLKEIPEYVYTPATVIQNLMPYILDNQVDDREILGSFIAHF